MTRHILFASGLALGLATPAWALPGLSGSFEVFSVDDSGGGWVVHHMPGRGDTLWGCQAVKSVASCTQVYMDEWKTGTSLSFIHITDKSQKGWLRVRAPGLGDYLLACQDPTGAPSCASVELELRPATSNFSRVWPDYDCSFACETDTCCGGKVLPETSPASVIEPAAKGDMWLELGIKVPGPVNLYACRNLETAPECQLTVPNWLALDRENVGIKKIEDIEVEAADGSVTYGPGVRVSVVDEESVAAEAGIAEGTVITKVGEFEVNRKAHARFLMLQYPALDKIPLTLDGGKVVDLVPNRKPSKKKK